MHQIIIVSTRACRTITINTKNRSKMDSDEINKHMNIKERCGKCTKTWKQRVIINETNSLIN